MDAGLALILSKEAASAADDLVRKGSEQVDDLAIPETGMDSESLVAQLRELKAKDNHAENGRLFGYVYTQHGGRYDVSFGLFGAELTDTRRQWRLQHRCTPMKS